MKFFKIIYHFSICIILIAAVTSCSSETGDEPSMDAGEMCEATFSISATRGTPAAASGNHELINSWWVALVDGNGKIAAIRNRDVSANPCERDKFTLRIPTGTYTIISFANRIPIESAAIPGQWNIQIGGKIFTFEEEKQTPISYGDLTLYDDTAPENWSTGKLIPMCGLQKAQITGRTDEIFEIEVVREVAKFEIEFENDGSYPAQVNSYHLEGFKSDAIYLFPKYSTLEGEPNLPDGASFIDINRPLSDFIIPPSDKRRPAIFYTLESNAYNQTHGCYNMTIDVSRLDTDGREIRRDTLTAPLTDIRYVNRNDHIFVPVLLSDYVMSVEATFYPPIGGYPAKVEQNDRGRYHITFGSIGEFIITPHIRKIAPGSGELSPGDFDMEISIESLQTENIFSREPAVDAETGEILGAIGTSRGKARVAVTFTVHRPGRTPLIYKRNILIERN